MKGGGWFFVGLALLTLGGAGCATKANEAPLADRIKAYAVAHPAAAMSSGDGQTETWLSRDVAQHGTPERLATFAGEAPVEARGLAKFVSFEDRYYVVFPDDFQVWSGPSLHVFASPSASVSTNFEQTRGVMDLGELKATKGAQIYTLPRGTDVSKLNAVIIWSESFHAPYAVASVQ